MKSVRNALISLGLLLLCLSLGGQEPTAPKFKFDPDWPKPLPNKWKMGGVTGLAVDKDDNVWVYDRPNDLTDIELEAELTPPLADCCIRPPSMIHIDKNGDVIGSFDAPQGHGMAVDSKGFAYLGQDTVRKYDTKTGQAGGRSAAHAGEAAGRRGRRRRAADVRPRSGPWQPRAGGRISHAPGGRPQPDAAAQAARQAATAAFRAKYPPTTPMIVGRTRRDTARRTGSRTLRRRQLPGRARDGV